MILNDMDIKQYCTSPVFTASNGPMIEPFVEGFSGDGVISYGLSSCGYDIRLGKDIYCLKSSFGEVINPKRFKEAGYRERIMDHRVYNDGDMVIVPANGYVLGTSLERFNIPPHLMARCLGKSTLARCSICINVTPLEPGWCMSEDTDALTYKGWKPIAEVQIGDPILTRNERGKAEYREVERKINRPFDGAMIHFKGRSVDQLVTPDHRMFVWPFKKDKPTLIPAEDIFGRWNFRMDRSVVVEFPDPETVTVAGKEYNAADFAEFYGCWLGDGSAYYGNDGGYHIKLAVVTKPRKRALFRSILAKLGIKAAEHASGFRWFGKDLALWLMDHGHARHKFVKPEFMNLSQRLSEKLLSGLISSDGNQQTQTFTTTSPQLANDAQTLAFLSGKSAIIRKTRSMINEAPLDAYKVRVCAGDSRPKMDPKNHHMVPYKGNVHCVTVPNHVWLCRRNGKVSWTGNCGQLTIEIGNSGPAPVGVFVGEGIAQIIFETLTARPLKTYADKHQGRAGKYQDQVGVTMPVVL